MKPNTSNIPEILKLVLVLFLMISYGATTLSLMMWVGPTVFFSIIYLAVMGSTLNDIILSQGFSQMFADIFSLVEVCVFLLVVITPACMWGEKIVHWWIGLYNKIENLF